MWTTADTRLPKRRKKIYCELLRLRADEGERRRRGEKNDSGGGDCDQDGGIDDSKKFMDSGGNKGDINGIGTALVGRKREETLPCPRSGRAENFFAILLMCCDFI